jgi:hypothetical protein
MYMEFPFKTQSKPVVGIEAQKLSEAINCGKSLTNSKARDTFNRILLRGKERINH